MLGMLACKHEKALSRVAIQQNLYTCSTRREVLQRMVVPAIVCHSAAGEMWRTFRSPHHYYGHGARYAYAHTRGSNRMKANAMQGPIIEMKVFTCNANAPLAQRICDFLEIPLGKASIGRFPDGEINLKIDEDVRGRDIFIVQPTCPPVNENLMELLVMIDAARRSSAGRITAVMPYYGYARKDRKEEGRVPITAKLVANLLVTAGANRVLALDLHATQIQGFFDIPLDHLFSFPVLCNFFQERGIENLAVATPDVGGIRMARAFATALGADLVVVDKRRIAPDRTESDFVIGNIEGKNVLLVDDMITTGGSITTAARLLRRHGARDIYAAAAHGVFCGPARERLADSPISEMAVTDSIPMNERALDLGDRLRVLSVSGLLGKAIRCIHTNQSVSSLFAEQ